MSTSRVAAARALVAQKLKASKKAIEENLRLKSLLAEKQEELKQIRELWQQLQTGESELDVENESLAQQVEEVEAEIVEILGKIEGEGDVEETTPAPAPAPAPKPEAPKNGKVLPPEDGGSPWLSLEDPSDSTELCPVNGTWRIDLSDDDMPTCTFPKVQFWGPIVGVVGEPAEATHYRVSK